MRPYMALLQGFNDDSAPKAKRRKLDHEKPSQVPATATQDEQMDDADRDIDQVEEPEDPAIDPEEQPEDDSSDEEEDSSDPFDAHFAHADEKLSAKSVQALKKGEWTTKRALLNPWRATYMLPGSQEDFEAPQPASGPDSLRLKQKLKETASKKIAKFSDAEKNLGPLLFGYQDLLHCDRTVRNSQSLRQLVGLHALNHIFKYVFALNGRNLNNTNSC